MSMLNRPADGAAVGETVASVRDYEAAQKTVSKLIAAEIPARDIAIVGQGVRTVERVTGRLGYAAAARSGAINGVLIGLLLSAFMVLGTPDAPIQLFVGFVLIGVALGMILSLVTYAVVRRRRDFASVMQLSAEHYEVTVQGTSLAKARQVLGSERRTTVARPPVDLTEPPRYGERISDAGRPAPASGTGGPAYGENAGSHAIPSRTSDAGAARPATDAGSAGSPERDATDAPADAPPSEDSAPGASASEDSGDTAPTADDER